MPTEFLNTCPYSDDFQLEDCNWYHTFDFNRGLEGILPEFDLFNYVDEFLLPKSMKGKSFLDIGTANGFFSFEMEQRGADVVSFDIARDQQTDQIPYRGDPDRSVETSEFIERFHKGYWYSHEKMKSKARAVYGNVNAMPDDLGSYDVVLLGSILQHLRDPLGAIIQADKHCKDTLIICEAYYQSTEPVMRFQANPDDNQPQYWTWWLISPPLLVTMMKTLGYRDIEVNGPFDMYHQPGQYMVSSVTVKGHKG